MEFSLGIPIGHVPRTSWNGTVVLFLSTPLLVEWHFLSPLTVKVCPFSFPFMCLFVGDWEGTRPLLAIAITRQNEITEQAVDGARRVLN